MTQGTVIILNGAPRSGKSSIARRIQESFDGIWMNLGVDVYKERIAPQKVSPGIGLRPGGERPDLEDMIAGMYRALYHSIRAHSMEGFNVVVDVGHHDDYTEPLGTLRSGLEILKGYPVWIIGVFCPIDVILERRKATGWPAVSRDDAAYLPIERWQTAVHEPGIYDLTLHTDRMPTEDCAMEIGKLIKSAQSGQAAGKVLALQ